MKTCSASGLPPPPAALDLPRAQTTSSGPNNSDAPGTSIEEDATALAEPEEPTSGTSPTALSDGASGRSGDTGSRGPRQQVAQIGMMLGRYELQSELGEGGMASVFGALDTKLGRDVAVKVMFPHLARRKEAASRFKREARAAAGLDHEHILRVFDVGGGEVVDGVLVPPYIVLERIDGASLDDFFREHEPPLAEVVAAIGVALCRGLAQAHAKNIVHRDIKPANVMVTNEGRLVLADFGVARVGDDDSVVTRTGAVLGTPAYMSPEQASSESVDARSDLYSLGATLYRIATGSMPYSGSAAQVVANILDGKRVPAEQRDPRIGRELSRVIDTLMQGDPADRYESAEEAEKALMTIVEGGGTTDAEALLAAYVRDPEGQLAKTRETAISANLVRARRMSVEGRSPLALAIAERVLALDPDNAQAQALSDSLGRSKRDHRRLLLAIFGPMVVTAVVGAVFWGSRPGAISSYADAAPSDAWVPPADSQAVSDAAVPAAQNDAAAVASDAAASESTTKNTNTRPRIKPRTERPADAGAVTMPAARPDAAPRAVEVVQPATLIVNITPWCDVWIDGDKRSRASATTQYQLAPGRHEIVCQQNQTTMSWQKVVNLRAGESRTLTGSVLSPVTVAVRIDGGDEVRIGSVKIRDGGSSEITMGRYRTQVWKAGKPVGEPTYLVLRSSCILRDEPKLVCSSR